LTIKKKECLNIDMNKSDAIKLLGGTPTACAEAIGITVQAVSDWPDVLSARISDRVYAALARKQIKAQQEAAADQAGAQGEPHSV